MSIAMINTEQDFEREVLQSSLPVLVDFSASWCQPCKMMAPILKGLADGETDSLKVVEVDVDQGAPIATRYGIQSVPTLMLFVGGEIKDRLSGYISKERLSKRLAIHLTDT